MQASSLFYGKNVNFSEKERRAYQREELAYNITEDILVAMEARSISKEDLARRIGKPDAYIARILGAGGQMTLGDLADICFCLELAPKVIIEGLLEMTKEKGSAGMFDSILKEDGKVSQEDSKVPAQTVRQQQMDERIEGLLDVHQDVLSGLSND